jgi:hypothetical protein
MITFSNIQKQYGKPIEIVRHFELARQKPSAPDFTGNWSIQRWPREC